MKRLALPLGLLLSFPLWAENKAALNTGYEHFSDIVFALPFVETTGNFVDLVNGVVCTPTGETRGTDGTYEEYVETQLDESDLISCADNAALDGYAAATFGCLVQNNKTAIGATGNEAIFAKQGASDDSYSVAWVSAEDVTANVGIGATNTPTSITDGLDDGSVGALATNWNFVGYTFNGLTITARVNAFESTPAAAVGTMNATAHALIINRDDSGTDGWDGKNAGCVMLDIELDDTDWGALASDFLQIFEPDAGGSVVGSGLLSSKALQPLRLVR